MKKIIASVALVAFMFAISAPTFAAVNYDKDPKAAKTETKKDEKKACCKDGKACCKDKSTSTEKKADATKK
jgi:uncharacterized protein YxeA